MTTHTYTKKEIAEALKVHPMTITNWIADGTLKALKIGGVVRITEESFNNLISGGADNA